MSVEGPTELNCNNLNVLQFEMCDLYVMID